MSINYSLMVIDDKTGAFVVLSKVSLVEGDGDGGSVLRVDGVDRVYSPMSPRDILKRMTDIIIAGNDYVYKV